MGKPAGGLEEALWGGRSGEVERGDSAQDGTAAAWAADDFDGFEAVADAELEEVVLCKPAGGASAQVEALGVVDGQQGAPIGFVSAGFDFNKEPDVARLGQDVEFSPAIGAQISADDPASLAAQEPGGPGFAPGAARAAWWEEAFPVAAQGAEEFPEWREE